ncbi:MAG: rhomboid family intramembrane serine protease [Myxococcota bacterium]|nr:rhomboid family intramembrane serine protease [Myxococcota bacterium]
MLRLYHSGRRGRRGVIWNLLFLFITVQALIDTSMDPEVPPFGELFWVMLVAFFLSQLVKSWREMSRPPWRRHCVVGTQGVTLSLTPEEYTRYSYDELQALWRSPSYDPLLSSKEEKEEPTLGKFPRLYLCGSGGIQVLSEGLMENPKEWPELVNLIERRLSNALWSSDEAQWRAVKDKSENARRLHEGRSRAAMGLCLLFFLAFVAQGMVGAAEGDLLTLLGLGANSPPLVAAGEWWRLCCANFLHAGLLHLLLNLWALMNLGGLLERLIGPWRLVTLLLGSGVLGALTASTYGGAFFSIGASTTVFGLLGSFAWLHLRFHRSLPLGVLQGRRWWGTIAILNLLFLALLPGLDSAGHLGGFCAGFLWSVLFWRQLFLPTEAPSLLAKLRERSPAFLVVGLHIWAFQQVSDTLPQSPEQRGQLTRQLLSHDQQFSTLAYLASDCVDDRACGLKTLQALKAPLLSATDFFPLSAPWPLLSGLTLARLGDFEAARERLWPAVVHSEGSTEAALLAYLSHDQRPADSLESALRWDGRRLHWEGATQSTPHVLWGVIRAEGKPLSLWRWSLPVDESPAPLRIYLISPGSEFIPLKLLPARTQPAQRPWMRWDVSQELRELLRAPEGGGPQMKEAKSAI